MNREQWLCSAVEAIRPYLADRGYEIPAYRVSCSFPSSGAKKTIGQTFSTSCSADKTVEIFVSPLLDDLYAANGIWATLVHELGHACLGVAAKHGKAFKQYCAKVGLDGEVKATFIGHDLLCHVKTIDLGSYPHAKLSLPEKEKKQTTRMIKCECPGCGYVIRTTRMHLERGVPTCCCGQPFEVCETSPGVKGDEGISKEEI